MNKTVTTPDDGLTRCDLCAKVIKDGHTVDISLFRTRFDEDGEVRKTMDDVSDLTDWDYVTIGEDCCKAEAIEAWRNMLISLGI